jgi:hypothetical protein
MRKGCELLVSFVEVGTSFLHEVIAAAGGRRSLFSPISRSVHVCPLKPERIVNASAKVSEPGSP